MAEAGRPQILSLAAEREVLRDLLHARVRRSLTAGIREDVTVAGGADIIAAAAVSAALARLRIMSGRQLAILLATVHEPPHYDDSRAADVLGEVHGHHE
jgi:hypothetical protein